MKEKSLRNLPKWLIPVVGGGILVCCVSSYYLLLGRSPHPPPAIVVLGCQDVAPRMHRIGSERFGPLLGIQFDIPEKDFTFRTTNLDMPPGTLYLVTVKNRNTSMEISNGVGLTFEKDLDSAFPVFSTHVEERNVRSPSGQVIGEDRWGYLRSGEVWRHVRFFEGDEVGYRPMALQEARLLDQVISSACIVPARGS